MNPIEKALWYAESRLSGDVTLDEIASAAGVSRFHLSRAFTAIVGRPVMTYVRGRRLSEAARVLANGAGDILSVALDAGYNSHEAFTRAFRDQFGVTPEQVRAQHSTSGLDIVEPFNMEPTQAIAIETPRFESAPALLIAGLTEHYDCNARDGIPQQWARLGQHMGHIPHQIGNVAYGVSSNMDDAGNFDYLCGVEVEQFDGMPAEFSRIRIPENRYVVFTHREHISTIRATWLGIWRDWFPKSGCEAVDAPNFERYSENFDPMTGNGGVEIWLPIKR